MSKYILSNPSGTSGTGGTRSAIFDIIEESLTPRWRPARSAIRRSEVATPADAYNCAINHAAARYDYEPAPAWEVDDARVAEAKLVFGIEWPITFRCVVSPMERGYGIAAYETAPWWRAMGSAGSYGPGLHRIIYAPGLPADFASICLWHELTHAKQAELRGGPDRFGRHLAQTGYAVARSLGGDAYLNHPAEYPAFLNMRNHFDLFPLTRPV